MLLIAKGWVIQRVLLSNLELIRPWRIRRRCGLVAIRMLASSDLSRHLCQCLQSSPGLSSHWEFDGWTIHLDPAILITSCITGEAIQLQERLLSIVNANTRAFLHKVCRQTVDPTFGKLLAARLARMLVAIARIIQFGASLKVLEDQGCRELEKVNR